MEKHAKQEVSNGTFPVNAQCCHRPAGAVFMIVNLACSKEVRIISNVMMHAQSNYMHLLFFLSAQ